MEWISIDRTNLPLEKPILVAHDHGIEGIQFFNAKWRYWYTGEQVKNDVLSTVTHFCIPIPPKP